VWGKDDRLKGKVDDHKNRASDEFIQRRQPRGGGLGAGETDRTGKVFLRDEGVGRH